MLVQSQLPQYDLVILSTLNTLPCQHFGQTPPRTLLVPKELLSVIPLQAGVPASLHWTTMPLSMTCLGVAVQLIHLRL